MEEKQRRIRFLPHGKGSAKVLGTREADIMDLLWQQGPATVSQVHQGLNRGHQVAYTTVMTIMSRLAKKGLLLRERSGNAYVYSPAITQEEFGRQVARGVVNGLLESFTRPALSYFVERLAAQDEKALTELEKLLQQKRKPGKGM